jgi:hypothetical protein
MEIDYKTDNLTEEQRDLLDDVADAGGLETFIISGTNEVDSNVDCPEFEIEVTGHWLGNYIVSFGALKEGTWSIEYELFK